MEKIKIQDLTPGLVKGIEVQMPTETAGYTETYFEWTASSLVAKFNTTEISGGILQTWHHVPVFQEVETHIDAEVFYYVSGVALMLFVDLKDGRPNMDSAQIVRIQPGTQLIVPAGKGHFVAVAEGAKPVFAVIVSPKMYAPRTTLPVSVEGI
jgi:dTDP-4-dehydrorhamnose 3,5-epimerase-like enzyme